MRAVIWCRKSGRCTDGPLGPLQPADLASRATCPNGMCVMTAQAIGAAGPVQRTATASLPAGTRRNATGLPTSATSVATGPCITPIAADTKTGHIRGFAASPGRLQLPSSMAEDPRQHTARMEHLGGSCTPCSWPHDTAPPPASSRSLAASAANPDCSWACAGRTAENCTINTTPGSQPCTDAHADPHGS